MGRVFALLILLLAACGETTATPPETTTSSTPDSVGTTLAAPDVAITIAGFRFSGDEVGAVGDTVEVTNNDTVGHTWTSTDGAFHSGVIGAGETYVHVFDAAGEYPYFCQIHPEMSGTVTIEG